MKIALNITREPVGGITHTTFSLLNYLHGLNYEFTAIELNSRAYMKAPVIFRPFSPELFDHHIVNIHNFDLQNIIKRSKTIKDVERAFQEPIKLLRKILQTTKPDVLVLSGTYHIPWLISIAAEKENIPIVLWYAGIYKRETEHATPKFHRMYSAMERSIVRRATKIIFPSTLCRTVVETEVVGHSLRNGYVVPNPISPLFTDVHAVGNSLDRRIATVGRYSKVKNINTFFEVHKKLRKRKWDHTATFITGHEGKIKSLPRSVNVLPPMDQEGLRRFYLTQGLIMCPSVFETFGNVPMEAACLGVPVLVSDQIGCADILKQVGLANMVMPFDDLDKVADRAIELCGQNILPKQLNALKKILDHRFVGEEIRAIIHSACKIRLM